MSDIGTTKRNPHEMKRLPCGCESIWQDQSFGLGIRTHNAMVTYTDKKKKSKGNITGYRCVVCKKENGVVL